MTNTTAPAARDFAAEFIAARRRANRADLTLDQTCRAIRKGVRILDAARAAGIELDACALDEQGTAAGNLTPGAEY